MYFHRPLQIFIIGFALATCVLGSQCDQSKGFKLGDQPEFEVKYHEKRQGRKGKPSYTEAEVVADVQAMLDESSCYDLSKVILEYLTRPSASMDQRNSNGVINDTWVKAGEETKKTASFGKHKWIVKVVPCFEYDFRIVVNGLNGREADLSQSNPKSLGPAEKEKIENSPYVPEMPTFISAQSVGSNTQLKFEASNCVESYVLFVKEVNEDDDDEGDGNDGDYSNGEYLDINSKDSNVIFDLTGLKTCTNYESSLQAIMSDRYSEEVEIKFSTDPNIQTAKNIILKPLEIGADFVSFSLDSPWKPELSCIKEYKVEICSNEKCLSSSIEKISDNNPTLETRKDGLTPCMDYELKITPQYENVTINPMSKSFRTISSDPNTPCPTITPLGKLSFDIIIKN